MATVVHYTHHTHLRDGVVQLKLTSEYAQTKEMQLLNTQELRQATQHLMAPDFHLNTHTNK